MRCNVAYDLKEYIRPVWEGDTVLHEPVGFITDREGKVRTGELLYTPEKILSVCSQDLTV